MKQEKYIQYQPIKNFRAVCLIRYHCHAYYVGAFARGITLVEILISLLIVSVILLGLLSGAGNAFYQTQTAYYASIATQQAQNIAMQIALNGEKNESNISDPLSSEQSLLPQEQVQITPYQNQLNITISWQDARQQHHVNYFMSRQVKT